MRLLFGFFRWLLVACTGRGYDRSDRVNTLHHKLAYRLHRRLPQFGIVGLQKVAPPALDGRHLYVRAEDGGVGHQFIMYREYEPFETEIVRERLKPGMTVFDIGANIGYYVTLASICVGETGRVIAFEPAPENLELLRRTVTENHLDNVTIVECAVGAEDGMATLALSPTNSGDHQLRGDTHREGVVVPVRSIDSLIGAGLPRPDAIIMDVQGSELDVLIGMKGLIDLHPPEFLMTEYWPRGLDARHPNGGATYLNTLLEAGFSIRIIDAKHKRLRELPQSKTGQTDFEGEVNLLCVRTKS
ncbi:MAG: FkbM family methyltransferase [Bacteroidota bacterium]|nr:FkbM family methyltransferase [Bacteroidota bacterium]MDP4232600.1 FkbM family methyltransferase [Bacteroidota bacterium]MDP4242946.1 FkbM family methyltransferase [Bacteroidota bacterium]MDP4286479.1 FkbM family methyltransferase [Bacteroidota bacterium]